LHDLLLSVEVTVLMLAAEAAGISPMIAMRGEQLATFEGQSGLLVTVHLDGLL
jgi:hypothetical protein